MTRYALDRRLTGPQDQSGLARNIAPQPGFDTVTVQPLASPHTDYAIPAHQDARTHTHVVFPVHTMKGHREKRGIAPLILNPGTRWGSVVNFTPRLLFYWERTPIPTEQDAGWAPEPVWSFWRRDKSPAPTGIRAPDRPARTLVSSDYAAPAPVVLSDPALEHLCYDSLQLTNTTHLLHIWGGGGGTLYTSSASYFIPYTPHTERCFIIVLLKLYVVMWKACPST